MSPDLAHGAAQYFDAQFNGVWTSDLSDERAVLMPEKQQPTYRDSTPDLTGPGWSNDLYASGSILGREFNYTVAELAGRGFPVPPLYPNGYAMVGGLTRLRPTICLFSIYPAKRSTR
jgi:hypothetical protein